MRFLYYSDSFSRWANNHYGLGWGIITLMLDFLILPAKFLVVTRRDVLKALFSNEGIKHFLNF
jgi:hypothetical protein